MSASTIAMYETNRRSPDREAITKLSGALGIPEALLTGEQTAIAKKPEVLSSPKKQSDGQRSKSSPDKAKKDPEVAATWVPQSLADDTKAEIPSSGKLEPDIAEPAAPALDDSEVEAPNENATKAHQRDALPGDWHHDEAIGEASSPSPALTELTLTRDEAKLILFVRMNPQSMEFFESYIRSDAKRREQLTRTWRLINDFQRSPS